MTDKPLKPIDPNYQPKYPTYTELVAALEAEGKPVGAGLRQLAEAERGTDDSPALEGLRVAWRSRKVQ